jgi:hypothetical protein
MLANIPRSPTRRFKALLHRALLPLLWLAMTAANAALVCTPNVASVPELDPNATSAELGELTLACSGGAEADPLPTVNIQSFFNVSLLQDVAPVLNDGTTDYMGTFSGPNSVVFLGIPLNPLASMFTFDRVFVDPGLLAAIDNPLQLVAIIGTGNAVPEPATVLLLVAACGGLLLLRRRGGLLASTLLRLAVHRDYRASVFGDGLLTRLGPWSSVSFARERLQIR